MAIMRTMTAGMIVVDDCHCDEDAGDARMRTMMATAIVADDGDDEDGGDSDGGWRWWWRRSDR